MRKRGEKGMSVSWNPWHGCHKVSEGCRNCYVYRTDERHQKDSSIVYKTADFDLPMRKNRMGQYKIAPCEMVYTCFTSDFLVEQADAWRKIAWEMMRYRMDLTFFFITKRIDRLQECLPDDWGTGYDNVVICCTVENQQMADYRLPIYMQAPIKHKIIVCSPLLGPINLRPYLTPQIQQVSVGGESGNEARVCDYSWVLDIRDQSADAQIPFFFQQTGAKLKKGNRIYTIPRKYQHAQARKAGISTALPLK